MTQETILITGVTGFLGAALADHLIKNTNYNIIATTRQLTPLHKNIKQIVIGDLNQNINWIPILTKVDHIIHLAGRAHIMQDNAKNPLKEFRKINTESTLKLAKQAAQLGIKRFIYLSSIKVNGEHTKPEKPFQYNDKNIPTDPYALSKYEAEQGLKQIAQDTGMQFIIIRPPLVYGPKVKANFLNMMQWLYKGTPLPLGSINNKRSLIALDNLIDLIITCINHPKAKNNTFLVSDDEDISTTELLKRMADALGKPSRLLAIPSSILTLTATLLGKKEIAQRLCNSLQVDIKHTKKTLDWKPPISINKALKKTANAFIKETQPRNHTIKQSPHRSD